MNMLEMLAQANGGRGLEALANKFQLQPSQAEQVARAVLPALSAGAKRQAASTEGLSGLAGMLRSNDAANAFDAPEDNSSVAQEQGAQFLENIFGGAKGDIEQAVSQDAAGKTGVDMSIIQQMLPVIAGMVLGGMQKRESSDSALGDIVGGLLAGGASKSGMGGMLGGLVGGLLGGGGSKASGDLGMLGKMLDADGDGSVADDIIGRFLK